MQAEKNSRLQMDHSTQFKHPLFLTWTDDEMHYFHTSTEVEAF